MQWVLTNNYCTFDNKTYLQITGTAIGTPFAPEFANLYLLAHDERTCTAIAPIKFFRYIDDLLVILPNDKDALTFLREYQDQYIQLDSILINRHGTFLDLTLWIKNTHQLGYKIFQKDINLYQYLPPKSFHKPYIFINLVANKLLRYRRNCSNIQDFWNMTILFEQRLKKHGYSYPLWTAALNCFAMRYGNTLQMGTGKIQGKYKNIQRIQLNFVTTIPRIIIPKLNFKKLLSIPEELLASFPQLDMTI